MAKDEGGGESGRIEAAPPAEAAREGGAARRVGPVGRIARGLSGPRAMTLIPTAMVGGYLLGGPTLLLAAGVIPPLTQGVRQILRGGSGDLDAVTGLPLRAGATARIDRMLGRARGGRGRSVACLVVEVDRFDLVTERFGHAAAEGVTRLLADRVAATCRSGDVVARLHGNAFAVVLAPARRGDPDLAIRTATRLQSALSEALTFGDATLALTASVGFCLSGRAPGPTGADLLAAAESALAEARRGGPATIRAYSSEMHARVSARTTLVAEAEGALEAGHILPWFQPQICARTGAVTGVEALARWAHPERGMIPPAEFLPALEQTGLMERLGGAMLRHALHALREWDAAGLSVPSISVNFSGDQLRSPALVDRIQWALDRHDLAPDRLTVEVLETVVSGDGDAVMTRNLHRLAALGCRIDLDDFGTGNASIGNIRRFAITRIKIDRSFVIGVEGEADRRRMVSAILTMAERLELETVAEGVETPAAHALLTRLGCGHVQGFGIARPMPAEDIARWLGRHAGAPRGACGGPSRVAG